MVLANFKAHDIIRTGSSTQISASDCGSNVTPISEWEFNGQRMTANVMRVGGISAIGAGVALVTWGLWRFFDEDATGRVTVSGGGFTWTF